MKSTLIVTALIALFIGLSIQRSHPQSSVNTREMMRFKLYHAQGVLEGIATENYALIETNAAKLNAMSQSADWRIRQTEEFQRFTADFSRQAVALEKAAKQKNVDAATVAYFQMTVSCVQCHKYLRGTRAAKLDLGKPERKLASGN